MNTLFLKKKSRITEQERRTQEQATKRKQSVTSLSCLTFNFVAGVMTRKY